MKIYGNKILKIILALSLFFGLTMIPAVFIFGEISEEYVVPILCLWLFLFIGFGLVGIILLVLGYRPDEPKKIKNNNLFKEKFSVIGPVVMRLSIVLIVICFLVSELCFVFIKDETFLMLITKICSFVSIFFAVICITLLLCCNPKESNHSEIYPMCFNDFTSCYYFMKNAFERDGFKKRFWENTKQGCEIYVYKKQRLSADYYFIINLKDWADENSLIEFERFRDEILAIDSFPNFGTVKVSSIICVNQKTDDFEQKLVDKTSSYRRWTNLCICVVLEDNKIYLPSCKKKVRIGLMKAMKREFRERLGISEVVSKNPLIRWIVGCCMEEKRIKRNAVLGEDQSV